MVLPDSSVVILNHGSRLSYSTDYNKSSRDVRLEGEACFQVARNEHVPFIVKTRQIDVKVLGTVFNVSAYGEEGEVATSLISGSVEIKNNMDNKHYHLTPNTSAVYDKSTKEIHLETFEREYAIGWTEGKLFLRRNRSAIFVRVWKENSIVRSRLRRQVWNIRYLPVSLLIMKRFRKFSI